MPLYMTQISSEYTKRAGMSKIVSVKPWDLHKQCTNLPKSRGFCCTGNSEHVICGYNPVQNWEVPHTNISVQPRLTAAVQTNTVVWCK